MKLNQFTVVKDLDIYDKVGYGSAHDEYIPFSIRKGELHFNGQKSPFPGILHVEFVKVSKILIKRNLLCLRANLHTYFNHAHP